MNRLTFSSERFSLTPALSHPSLGSYGAQARWERENYPPMFGTTNDQSSEI
ncbi:MAG TPA: hypothetical protein VGJ73_23840 [Verrucomicrobiae bacterium]